MPHTACRLTSVDGAANVHAGANGPELLEVGMITLDRWGVDASFLPLSPGIAWLVTAPP